MAYRRLMCNWCAIDISVAVPECPALAMQHSCRRQKIISCLTVNCRTLRRTTTVTCIVSSRHYVDQETTNLSYVYNCIFSRLMFVAFSLINCHPVFVSCSTTLEAFECFSSYLPSTTPSRLLKYAFGSSITWVFPCHNRHRQC